MALRKCKNRAVIPTLEKKPHLDLHDFYASVSAFYNLVSNHLVFVKIEPSKK